MRKAITSILKLGTLGMMSLLLTLPSTVYGDNGNKDTGTMPIATVKNLMTGDIQHYDLKKVPVNKLYSTQNNPLTES